jgi:hydroquinone glucosyltransferase
LATFLHIPELVIQGHLPHIEPSKDNFLVHDIPGVPPTRIIDLPSPIMDHTHYEYDFYLRNAAQMHEATGVLINTFYELEPDYIDVLRKTVYGVDENGQVSELRESFLLQLQKKLGSLPPTEATTH